MHIILLVLLCILSIEIKPEQDIIVRILLNRSEGNPYLLSHQDFVLFGQTSKENHYYLLSLARKKKEYCLSFFSARKSEFNNFVWHTYGTRASSKRMDAPELCLRSLELRENGQVYEGYGKWNDFADELFDQYSFDLNPKSAFAICPVHIPYYDADKRLCFIGYGIVGDFHGEQSKSIFLYRQRKRLIHADSFYKDKEFIDDGIIFPKGVECRLRYVNNYKGHQSYGLLPLKKLSNFPYLLAAIINSKKERYEAIVKNSKHYYFIYDLYNIILPSNYKQFVQCEMEFGSKPLSKGLERALEKRYKEQRTSRKIKEDKKASCFL